MSIPESSFLFCLTLMESSVAMKEKNSSSAVKWPQKLLEHLGDELVIFNSECVLSAIEELNNLKYTFCAVHDVMVPNVNFDYQLEDLKLCALEEELEKNSAICAADSHLQSSDLWKFLKQQVGKTPQGLPSAAQSSRPTLSVPKLPLPIILQQFKKEVELFGGTFTYEDFGQAATASLGRRRLQVCKNGNPIPLIELNDWLWNTSMGLNPPESERIADVTKAMCA